MMPYIVHATLLFIGIVACGLIFMACFFLAVQLVELIAHNDYCRFNLSWKTRTKISIVILIVVMAFAIVLVYGLFGNIVNTLNNYVEAMI